MPSFTSGEVVRLNPEAAEAAALGFAKSGANAHQCGVDLTNVLAPLEGTWGQKSDAGRDCFAKRKELMGYLENLIEIIDLTATTIRKNTEDGLATDKLIARNFDGGSSSMVA
jgi:uncharacterized protein YukE